MDEFETTAAAHAPELAERAEHLREIVTDVKALPETQRSALLLREMEGLPYEQIASILETTVPSVKSLLVRARMGLAEAAEARPMLCADADRLAGDPGADASARRTARRHIALCSH